MAYLKEFTEYLQEQADNRSIYVWGAQGQQGDAISEAWIRNRETTAKNAERAISFWKKQCSAGYGRVLRAFDCSGLGVYFLLEHGLIEQDLTANGFMGRCVKIPKDRLRIGDFVFKTNSKGRATHIGYIADCDLNVIEAKGRDFGVTKSKLSGWSAYGRPPYWTEDEVKKLTQANDGAFVFSRVLKYGVQGDDVRELKKLLAAAGYGGGLTVTNGNYLEKTEAAVVAYQKATGLDADGKAGPLTVSALGGVWKG